MGPKMGAELADDALKMALARRNPPAGCIHHSDPRGAIRQPAAGQDHEGERHRAVDGVHIVAVGQRGDRVAHGRHQVRMRARGDLRRQGAGRDRAVRIHRAILQQATHPLGAGMAQPRGIRGSAWKGRPPTGDIGPVNENGLDSDSDSSVRRPPRTSAPRPAASASVPRRRKPRQLSSLPAILVILQNCHVLQKYWVASMRLVLRSQSVISRAPSRRNNESANYQIHCFEQPVKAALRSLTNTTEVIKSLSLQEGGKQCC